MDLYNTGKKYAVPGEGTTREFVQIHYDYSSGKLNISYGGPDSSIPKMIDSLGYPQLEFDEVAEMADKILKKLGMSRL